MDTRDERHLVLDASCALATRHRVDDLMAQAAAAPGVPERSLTRLAEMVDRGEIARAARAYERVQLWTARGGA